MNDSLALCSPCKTQAKPGAHFCSKCGQTLQATPTVQPSRPQPVQPQPAWQGAPPIPALAQVELRIVMPVAWHLTDTNVDVFLDGQHVGCGSFNKGIDLRTTTPPGSHVLELGADVAEVGGTIFSSFSTRHFRKTWKLAFGLSALGGQIATLKYSRVWGNFKVQVT